MVLTGFQTQVWVLPWVPYQSSLLQHAIYYPTLPFIAISFIVLLYTASTIAINGFRWFCHLSTSYFHRLGAPSAILPILHCVHWLLYYPYCLRSLNGPTWYSRAHIALHCQYSPYITYTLHLHYVGVCNAVQAM